jgi:hypothetical protein
VILNDGGDYNNASAWDAPRNGISVLIAPTNKVYETAPCNESINHTMNHELAHVCFLDGAGSSDRFFRGIFAGKIRATDEHPESIVYELLTRPRRVAPRWYHEGIATFLETWLAGGIGRAQGAYDEMVFRSMVKDGSRFYDPLGLESEGAKVDFQAGANSYLYGTRFMSYLGYVHSPDSLIQWVGRGKGSKGYYTSQFKKVYGISLDDAWQDWIRWEHEFQKVNLDSVALYPLTPYRDLSPRALGSVSRAYFDPGTRTLYAGVNYPGVVSHLAAISVDDGRVDFLHEIKGPAMYFVTSLAFDPGARTLFYTTDNGEWRDLNVFNLRTGKDRRLMKDVRIGDLAFDRSDSSLWGIRHFNAISTLVNIPKPYDRWHQVYSWPYGRVMYDLDVSPDGRTFAYSISEISGKQTLHLGDVESFRRGEPKDRQIYDFNVSLPANFTFAGEGGQLLGSSYYTGISNIWRYDVARDSMEIVTNIDSGFFRPVPLGADSLIVFRYTGEGFVPAVIESHPLTDVSAVNYLGTLIADKHPVVRAWNVGSPAKIPLDSLKTYDGEYHGLRHLGLIKAYPVAQGYKDYGAVGLNLGFQDPGFSHVIDLTATYTPTDRLGADERFHGALSYETGPWKVDLTANDADFYDLFGPTKTSRKGESLGLRYKKSLINDDPKSLDLTAATTGYIDLERLPYAQNITVSFSKLWSTYAELSYKNLRASMGAVDFERGYSWKTFAVNNFANEKTFPLFAGTFDVGAPLVFSHSSLWLRTAAGYSPGNRIEPFANFYFGGFGNNWVDHGEVKRYRNWDSFPGIEINEAGGTNFAKATLDWNLPPLRFRRVGTTWFYVTWARASIFTSGLVTNMDDPDEVPRQILGSLGAQVDFRFTLLSHLNMTLSGGYAGASVKDRKPSDEFMFSLKIL